MISVVQFYLSFNLAEINHINNNPQLILNSYLPRDYFKTFSQQPSLLRLSWQGRVKKRKMRRLESYQSINGESKNFFIVLVYLKPFVDSIPQHYGNGVDINEYWYSYVQILLIVL